VTKHHTKFQTCNYTGVWWGKVREIGSSLHYVMVVITREDTCVSECSP